jgi:hypothetical protein
MDMSQYSTPAERAARKAVKKAQSTQIIGAGDAFAIVAQPIARAIDKVAGTNIANCEPCKKRRKAWNAAIPFGKKKN